MAVPKIKKTKKVNPPPPNSSNFKDNISIHSILPYCFFHIYHPLLFKCLMYQPFGYKKLSRTLNTRTSSLAQIISRQ